MEIGNRFKKLGKDFLLLTIGNFSSKILVFLLVPLYTSILSTNDYGTVDLITTTVSLIMPVLTLTISESVMRFALDKNSDEKGIFTIGIMIVFLSILILLLFSPLIYFINALKDYYWLILMYYISYSLNVLVGQFIKGINKVKSYTISGVISTLVTIVLNIILLIYFQLGIVGYLLSMIMGAFASVLYLFYREKLFSFLKNICDLDKDLLVKMVKYSLPLIFNNIAWWVINSSDRYMLLFYENASIVGLYSVAYKIPTILTTFSSLFSTSLRISSVENFKSRESNSFLNKTYKMYFRFVTLLTVLLIVFTKVIAKILFQNEFYSAWKISPILVIGFMFYTLSEFLGVIYIADKKTSSIFITCIMGAVVNVIFNMLLIPYLSGIGAAIGTLFGYFVIWITRSRGVLKIIPIYIDIKEIFMHLIFITLELVFLYIDYKIMIIIGLIHIIFMIVNITIESRMKNDRNN